jgi:hypothetical protein
MINNKLVILVMVIFFSISCSNDKSKIAMNEIDFNSITIEKLSVKDFISNGNIKKVVKLDANDKSLIGNINLVRIDANGDILVGDYYSAKKIHRFNKAGKYISSYGHLGRGPGEYLGIKSFDILSDGSIVLLTDLKLIRYAKSGQLIKEIRTNFAPMDIAIIDDLIYIAHLGFRTSPITDEAILIYNTDFKKVGGLLDFDTRLESYKFIPSNFFAKNGKILYFIDYYDIKLLEYDPKYQAISCLKIPSDNFELNAIWGKKVLSENDYREIKKRVHRFNYVYGFKDGLLLLAYCAEKRIFDYWVLNLEKRKAIVYKYSAEYFKDNLFFDTFAGGYDSGVIAAFNDHDKFNKYKDKYPVFRNIEYRIEDNPILVFFEFNNSSQTP